jgi:hypothetical protein
MRIREIEWDAPPSNPALQDMQLEMEEAAEEEVEPRAWRWRLVAVVVVVVVVYPLSLTTTLRGHGRGVGGQNFSLSQPTPAKTQMLEGDSDFKEVTNFTSRFLGNWAALFTLLDKSCCFWTKCLFLDKNGILFLDTRFCFLDKNSVLTLDQKCSFSDFWQAPPWRQGRQPNRSRAGPAGRGKA